MVELPSNFYDQKIELKELISQIAYKLFLPKHHHYIPKILKEFKKYYTDHQKNPYHSMGIITHDFVFQHTLNNFYYCLAYHHELRNNYQYWVIRGDQIRSNKRSELTEYLDHALQFWDNDVLIYFPRGIMLSLSIHPDPYLNETKQTIRTDEDKNERIIRENLKEFLAFNNLEHLQKTSFTHVINFIKHKTGSALTQGMAKTILQFLKNKL